MRRTSFPLVSTAAYTALASSALLLSGCAVKPQSSLPLTRPKGTEAYIEGAKAMDAGDKDHAVVALQRAISENPDMVTPRIMLGGIYREDNDYAKAIEQYENLVRLDPYTASNHYFLGMCYQLVDRLQEAALSYQKALKLKPDDADANMNLGLVYLATGKMKDSVQYTKRATELAPSSATAWANYGVTLDAAGDYPNAEAAYRRALELDGAQPTTLLNLATNLVMQKRANDAIPIFQRVLASEDSALARKRYGDALAQAKRYDDAIQQYDHAIKMNPRYFPAYNEIGKAFIAQYRAGYELDDAQRQSALAAWKKSLDINPGQPDTQALVSQWNKQPLVK